MEKTTNKPTCNRCHKTYEPNNYQICDECVSELEYQASYDEEWLYEANAAEEERMENEG